MIESREEQEKVNSSPRQESRGALKPQEYISRYPPEHYWPFHYYARTHLPRWWVYVVMKLALQVLLRIVPGVTVEGRENIPKEGAVIFSPNHFSFIDHFVVGIFIRRRRVRFIAKSQLFDMPVLRQIYKWGGVIPACRGRKDSLVFETAEGCLGDGQSAIMYWEGGRSRTHHPADTAKYGIGKLSLVTGAPIVPVAVEGTQFLSYIWKPWKWRRVKVVFGVPIYPERNQNPSREECQELADEVGRRSRASHAAIGRTPRWWLVRWLPA